MSDPTDVIQSADLEPSSSQDVAAGSASGGSDSHSKTPEPSAIEASFARAEARLRGDTDTAVADGAKESAGVGASDSGSTPEAIQTDTATTVDQEATSGPATAASTAAPDNWPTERREAFSKLAPDAQALTLDFYRDMQAGFTKATQGVAEIKQQAADYARLQREAQADPAGFVRALMESLKLTPASLAADEPPEFASAAELAKWTAQQAERAAERRFAALRAESDRTAAQQRAGTALDAELAELGKHPGFAAVREAAIQAVVDSGGALTLTNAFHLQRLPALLAAEQRGKTLAAELAAMKAGETERKKAIGAPVQGRALPTRERALNNAPLDPYEAAFERARARLQAAA